MAKTNIVGFQTIGADKPKFIGRIDCIADWLPPVRAYVHRTGTSIFLPSETLDYVEAAKTFLISSLERNFELIRDADFLLAAMWKDNHNGIMDLFKYTDTKNWPGNPEVAAYVLKNFLYIPEERSITCGDTLMVLGLEETHRRTTKDLTDYMENPIEIEGLIPFTRQEMEIRKEQYRKSLDTSSKK